MDNDDLSALRAALERRGIQTMRTVATDPSYVAVSMSTYSAQEFLNAIAPGPLADDDWLAMRIVGRPQDLGVGDEPWRFEAIPSVRNQESGIELHIIVSIPESDLREVLGRLGARSV